VTFSPRSFAAQLEDWMVASTTIRLIHHAFNVAGIERHDDDSGKRRPLVKAYLERLDLDTAEDVRRLIEVTRYLLSAYNIHDQAKTQLREICENSGLYQSTNGGIELLDWKQATPVATSESQSDSPPTAKLSETARRDIVGLLLNRGFTLSGRLGDLEFFGRLFDLPSLPSTDSRREFDSAEKDIHQHRVRNPDDWKDDWWFTYPPFNLVRGPAPDFLRAICYALDPEVRGRDEDTAGAAQLIEEILSTEGWRLREVETIAGRPRYAAQYLGTTPAYRFDVALSFAGDYRAVVEQIALRLSALIGSRERVFYDSWYDAELAKPNLDLNLQRIYRDESRLICIFLCAEYNEKHWCKHEWRAIRDLIKSLEGDRVMYFRFDDAPVDGMLSTDGYIDCRGKSPNDLAAKIVQRIAPLKGSSPIPLSDRRRT